MFGSDHMRVFVNRLTMLAVFVAALWAAHLINWALGYPFNHALGLIPRRVSGLDGVLAMPFLHGSFEHLTSNTPPLLLMGALLAATATRALLAVNAVIILLGGGLLWLFGATGVHIGASGLVFGWFGFLVTRGIVDRSLVTIGVALLVGLLYGSIIWGVFPGQPGVSWEAHLFGAIAGALASVAIPTHVHAPRVRAVERM